jgi:hydrogenase-4 component F
MLLWLIFMPVAAGVAALIARRDAVRHALLVLAAVAHAGLVVAAGLRPAATAWSGGLRLDPLGLLFLGITSALFLVASIYAVAYLRHEQHGQRTDFQDGLIFSNAPEAFFVACLLFFLAAMTLVTLCQHFGLLWVGIEATTLASAPLIYFHRHRRSLEATWKYLMICSVGIALALLGYLLLSVAGSNLPSGSAPMLVGELVRRGSELHVEWVRAAFLLFLVGYGTKMGLAPLHTWLPDAHSESPSVVSALLSGALLNCAFLGILRVLQVCLAAGAGDFGRDAMVALGLLSMAVAAAFLVGQTDFKRMLAYSSVEHMGILMLGVGLGGGAVFGAALHAVNHSLTKGMLFLTAGNILAAYKTKSAAQVRGVLRVLPASGVLWVLGFFAITGSPPFGPFLSELAVLKGALDGGRTAVAVLYLLFLAIVFVGMAGTVLSMSAAAGAAPAAGREGPEGPDSAASLATRPRREAFWMVAPPALLALAVTALGVYVPSALQALLHAAARALGGS